MSVLVAIGVASDGFRQILGVAEGEKEGIGIYALMDDSGEDGPGEMLSIIAFEGGYYDRNRTSAGPHGASEELG